MWVSAFQWVLWLLADYQIWRWFLELGKYCSWFQKSRRVLRTEFSDLEVWSSLGTKIKPKHWRYLCPIFYRFFIGNKSINPTDSVLKSYPETNLIFNFSHSFLKVFIILPGLLNTLLTDYLTFLNFVINTSTKEILFKHKSSMIHLIIFSKYTLSFCLGPFIQSPSPWSPCYVRIIVFILFTLDLIMSI